MMSSLSQVSRSMIVAALVAATVISVPVSAHHGGGAEWLYDQKAGPITGTATKFGFTFPHTQIYMDVTDEDGNVTNWAMVMRWTPTVLRKNGWSRDSIKPGDKITVTYIPHRSNENVGSIMSLEVNDEPVDIYFYGK